MGKWRGRRAGLGGEGCVWERKCFTGEEVKHFTGEEEGGNEGKRGKISFFLKLQNI